jgi:hypothetical protein
LYEKEIGSTRRDFFRIHDLADCYYRLHFIDGIGFGERSTGMSEMEITFSKTNTFVAFQPFNQVRQATDGRLIKKVGFVCEAKNETAARDEMIWFIAEHCTNTGQHPEDILDAREAA